MLTPDEPLALAISIRPMGVGEVLDAGFSLARRHFRLLAMVVAWGIVPGQALSAVALLLLAGFQNVMITATLGVASLVGNVISAFGSTLAFFAVTIACARLVDPSSSSVPLQVGPLYRAALRCLWRWVLFSLMLVVLALPLIILFPLGIYLLFRWAVAGVVLIVERTGPIRSLKRSWSLTAQNWWHTCIVMIVMGIVMSVLQSVVGGLVGLSAVLIGESTGVAAVTVLGALSTSLAGVIFTPFSVAIYCVLYYELRARSEGFDLEQRAHQLIPGE